MSLQIGNKVGIGHSKGAPFNWRSYWTTRTISNLNVTTTSDTEQTITATLTGTGYDGVSWEYSINGVTYNVHGTSALGTYSATGLTEATKYYWRARLYKGTHYSSYCSSDWDVTRPTAMTDGDTVAWFLQDLTTITKDGSNLVSRWNDKLGSGHDLIQATGTNQPTWSADGITFDGVDNKMETANFTYNVPAFWYLVLKQLSWTNTETMVEGKDNSYILLRQAGTTPKLGLYAGTALNEGTGKLAINTLGIVRCLFNGANSSLQINNETANTGNSGTVTALGGIKLGEEDGAYSHFLIKEVIFRKAADAAATQTKFYNFLAAKHGFFLI